MDWNSRASRIEKRLKGLSEWTHWKTRNGTYRVSRSRWLGRDGLPTVFYACILKKGCWAVISKHRKKTRAIEACEKHDRLSTRAKRKVVA